MSTGITDAFTESVAETGATVDVVPAADAESAIAAAVDAPAVGTPLPFEGVGLPEPVGTDPSPSDLADAETGVTPARLGVAALGSILIRSTPEGDEPVSLYPNRHVAVVAASALVDGTRDAVDWLADEFESGRDSYVFATGPSATADMGGLVEGVHGPNEVHVIVIEDR
ncbi:LUD domain-containing protein [Haloarchaeobius sp. HME9146]|uniref:LUD domain-containing protein n=1 Tax=Haloarchaeobius sp. HME9146 TaxID=2978732 RepID=UPI0021BE3B50|nr:LUD domain-containing protein [Haloarchaeobius sp. HME9146]MCT9094462.1 LUD domain-containing protein [Haloarchaeobius sp. HME9146]